MVTGNAVMISNNLDQVNIKTRRFYTMLMALTVVPRPGAIEPQSTLSTYVKLKCSASPLTPERQLFLQLRLPGPRLAFW